MNKLAIITTNHNRETILDLYCAGIERIKSQTDIEIISIIVGDENSITPKYDCIHMPYKNEPLTEKFNVAYLKAKEFNPDYVMVNGSDDLFPAELINYVFSKPEHDFFSIKDVYFYSVSPPHTNQVCYISTSTVGAFRFLRRDLSDKLKWKPWRIERSRGIDVCLWREVEKNWVNPHLFLGQPLGIKVVDVKSKESINGMEKWSKTPRVHPRDVLTFLSDKERAIVKQLLSL